MTRSEFQKFVKRVQSQLDRIVVSNATSVYDFEVITKVHATVMIRFVQFLPCIRTNENQKIKGRKWYISPHSTNAEILRTAFAAYKMFIEHEINENFLVDGERFLNPHPEGARP